MSLNISIASSLSTILVQDIISFYPAKYKFTITLEVMITEG